MVIHDLATSDLGAKVSELAGPGGCHGGSNWVGAVYQMAPGDQVAASHKQQNGKAMAMGDLHCHNFWQNFSPPKRFFVIVERLRGDPFPIKHGDLIHVCRKVLHWDPVALNNWLAQVPFRTFL